MSGLEPQIPYFEIPTKSLLASLTLREPLALILGGSLVAVLLLVWMVLRLAYERSVIRERITIVQQYLEYVRSVGDVRAETWIEEGTYVAREITERPSVGGLRQTWKRPAKNCGAFSCTVAGE